MNLINSTPEITVYGADWCPDCRRAKRILDERQTPYRWVDIDKNREGEKFVIQTNRGNRSIPTIVFGDGSILVEPSNAKLSEKLFETHLV
jgi:glutaredoxin-like protein